MRASHTECRAAKTAPQLARLLHVLRKLFHLTCQNCRSRLIARADNSGQYDLDCCRKFIKLLTIITGRVRI